MPMSIYCCKILLINILICITYSDCQNWQGGFSCICQDGYNPQFDPQTQEVEWCEPTCNVMTCGEGTFCNSDDNGAFCEDLNECMLVESCPTMDHQCENINCAIEECQVFGDGFICHEPQVGCKPCKNGIIEKIKKIGFLCVFVIFFKIA